jgi:hypothetical protein
VIPIALAHAAVERHDPAHEGEHEREGAVCHLLYAVVGHVADPHAAIRRGGRVYVVVAHAASRDDTERGQPVHLGGADRSVGTDEEPDHVLPLPRARGLLDLGQLADDLRHLVERVIRIAHENPHASPSP